MTYGFRSLRFVLASAFALAPVTALVALPSTAYADDEADAAAANDAGKQAMYASDFAGATAKFTLAADKSPQAKYALNLCNALFQEGKFDASLKSCKDANGRNPDAKTADKISKMIEKIRAEARVQKVRLFDEVDPNATPSGDPNGNPNGEPNGDPNGTPNPNPNGNPTGVGQPPAVGKPPLVPQIVETPKHLYTWTLGGSLAGGAGETDKGSSINVAGLRLHGDYLFAPQIGVGAQLRVDLFTVSGGYANSNSADLANVGIGIYKHIPLNRLVITPLAGIAGYTLSDPTTTDARISGTSLYVGASVGYAMGGRGEHLLHASVDYNRALSGTLENTSDQFEGFSYATVGVGYTYRFNTPLGSARSGGSFFLD